MRRGICIPLFLGLCLTAFAQKQSDTTEVRRNRQNVMLNASSTSQPRLISLGMPQWGTQIMEDGQPASMYCDFFPGYWSWHNGLGTESFQLTTLDESALELCVAGYFASTRSKTGADKLSAGVDYTANIYGRNAIEVGVATPLGKGWGLSLDVFQDFDPGSNHLDASYLQQRIRFYKAATSKSFADGRGIFKATYSFMNTYSFNDSYGPFIFVGDGSVKEYGGFRLGRDQYLPSTTHFGYEDVKTGEMMSRSFANDCSIRMHTASASLAYTFAGGVTLEAITRIKAGGCDLAEPSLGGISRAALSDGYTFMDGSPFAGNLQTRFLMFHDASYFDSMTTLRLKASSGRHHWTIGANIWIASGADNVSTSNFAYEVTASPRALQYNDQTYYAHNIGAQYFDGSQKRFALFARDSWNISERFNLRAGLRLEYDAIRGDAANNLDGSEYNNRFTGWSLASPGVGTTPIVADNFNWAVAAVATWRISDRLSLEADAIALQQHSELWQYGDADLPSQLPIRTVIFRAGVNFKNEWIDLQSMITYIRKANNYASAFWTHELTSAIGDYPIGYPETLYVPSRYGMDAIGWTTDVLLTPFKGFTFHGLLTLRDPRYRDYSFSPRFSDGYTETYDFSAKSITGTSKAEIELEPSYQTERWRFWLSIRYYGRQYINITNSLWLKSRWETFGGVDFKLSEKISLSASVVNFLCQTGASAGMQAASLATDPSPFTNYLTSGTYIRPFTLEFGAKIRL